MASKSRIPINFALLFLFMYFYPRRFRRRYSFSRKQRNRYARTILKKPQNVNLPIDPTQVQRYKDFLLRNNLINFPSSQPPEEPEDPIPPIQTLILFPPDLRHHFEAVDPSSHLHTISQPKQIIFETNVSNVIYLCIIRKPDGDIYLWAWDHFDLATTQGLRSYYTPDDQSFNGSQVALYKCPCLEEPSYEYLYCYMNHISDQFNFTLPVSKCSREDVYLIVPSRSVYDIDAVTTVDFILGIQLNSSNTDIEISLSE